MSSTDTPTPKSTVEAFHAERTTAVHWIAASGSRYVVQVYDGNPIEGNSQIAFGAPDGTNTARCVIPDEVFVEFARGVAEMNDIATARIKARRSEVSEALVDDEPNDDDLPAALAPHVTQPTTESTVAS